MTSDVERSAGFAAFRQGRSLCIRLDGTLDARTAREVAAQIGADRQCVRLRLECSTLQRLEPEAARILAHALLAWSRIGDGRSVDILNLAPALQRRIAWHPLRTFCDADELVFIDPDRDETWGTTPSRH